MSRGGLVRVVTGAMYDVVLSAHVAEALQGLDTRARARVGRSMTHFANDGPQSLHKEVYRYEGRWAIGDKSGRRVAIYAFKGWRVRIYGAVVRMKDKPTFIGTEIDVAKKRDRADRGKIERAARNLAGYL